MRLIDAEVLLNQLEDWRGDKEDLDMEDGHDVAYYSAMSRAMRFVKFSPTIDAVPAVRCKDCKYAFQNNGHDKEGCPIMDRRVWMDGNSFCSEGKRMDGEAE